MLKVLSVQDVWYCSVLSASCVTVKDCDFCPEPTKHIHLLLRYVGRYTYLIGLAGANLLLPQTQ